MGRCALIYLSLVNKDKEAWQIFTETTVALKMTIEANSYADFPFNLM